MDIIKVCIPDFHYSPIAGTSFKDYIDISYNRLVKTFGKPNKGEDKTDAEWIILTSEGCITIYNYKDGKNYLGNKGLKTKDITEWHIGGEIGRNEEKIKNIVTKLLNPDNR